MSVPTETPVMPPLPGVSQARSASDRQSDPERAKRSESAVGGELGDRVHINANNLDNSAVDDRRNSRVEQAKLRKFVRKISELSRVRKCGHTVRRKAGVGIAVDMSLPPNERISGFRGLYSCASVWACPRCSAVIGITRGKETRSAIKQWRTQGAVIARQRRVPMLGPLDFVDRKTGELLDEPRRPLVAYYEDEKHEPGKVGFLTLTFKHTSADRLDDLWRGISKAWERLTRDSDIMKRTVPGWIRAAELTVGKSGWHVHLHIALFVDSGWDQGLAKKKKKIFESWKKACAKLGFYASPKGFDLTFKEDEESDDALANYLTKESRKWDLASELTGAMLKTANGENHTPREILAILQSESEGVDLGYSRAQISRFYALYKEYEEASKGKKQLTWSAGLKRATQIEEVPDDEASDVPDDDQAAVDSVNQETEEIAGFPSTSAWAYWRDYRIDFQYVVESASKESVYDDLRSVGTEFKHQNNTGTLLYGSEWTQHLEAISKFEIESKTLKSEAK